MASMLRFVSLILKELEKNALLISVWSSGAQPPELESKALARPAFSELESKALARPTWLQVAPS